MRRIMDWKQSNSCSNAIDHQEPDRVTHIKELVPEYLVITEQFNLGLHLISSRPRQTSSQTIIYMSITIGTIMTPYPSRNNNKSYALN